MNQHFLSKNENLISTAQKVMLANFVAHHKVMICQNCGTYFQNTHDKYSVIN